MEFVTPEIAKKLKEKGFREKCLCRYRKYSKILLPNEVQPQIARRIDYSEFFKCYNSYIDNDIDAPTITQVLKWLRNDRYFHVSPDLINDYSVDDDGEETFHKRLKEELGKLKEQTNETDS